MSGPTKTNDQDHLWKMYRNVFRSASPSECRHRLLEMTGLVKSGWYDPARVLKKLQATDARLLTNYEFNLMFDHDVPSRMTWLRTLFQERVSFVSKHDGCIVTAAPLKYGPHFVPTDEQLGRLALDVAGQPKTISPVVSLTLPIQQPGLSGPRYQRLRGAQFMANLMLCNPEALVTMGSDPEGNEYHCAEDVYDEPDREGKLPVITIMPGYPFELERYP